MVDTREPMDLKALLSFTFPLAEVRKLDSADLAIADGVGGYLGIERKEIGDLLSALRDKQANGKMRFWNQLARMATDYPSGLLLIEGHHKMSDLRLVTIRNRKTGWSVASLQMAILSIQTKYPKIQVLWTSGMDETVETIRTLVDRVKMKGPLIHGEYPPCEGDRGEA